MVYLQISYEASQSILLVSGQAWLQLVCERDDAVCGDVCSFEDERDINLKIAEACRKKIADLERQRKEIRDKIKAL